ncbi:MAG TPA: hypothetical protein VK173_01040 [Lacibacter sp.]|nr:hypothetical protein [Lacibacter sp.]
MSIELDNKRVRLVIYQGSEERVCRKENISRIKEFLVQQEGRLFKGRLQLHKIDQQINIEVKGKVIGNLDVDHFTAMLQNATV